MSVRLVGRAARLLAVLALPAAAFGDPVPDDLHAALFACGGIGDGVQRLACYDALAGDAGLSPLLQFSGSGSGTIGPVSVPASTRLHFESDDAVLVIYLFDDQGNVLQNLHRAGAGAGSHDITAAGSYRIQIDATGGWRITLRAAT